MAATIVGEMEVINRYDIKETIYLYDDYKKFDYYDGGNYVAVQINATTVGYMFSKSFDGTIFDQSCVARFIDKNGNERGIWSEEIHP